MLIPKYLDFCCFGGSNLYYVLYLIFACIWDREGIVLFLYRASDVLPNALTNVMGKWLAVEYTVLSYENNDFFSSSVPILVSFNILFLVLFYGTGGWREQ